MFTYLLSVLSVPLSLCVCLSVDRHTLWLSGEIFFLFFLFFAADVVASGGDSRTKHRFNDLATKSEKWNGKPSPDWNVSMVDIHLRKLPWVPIYCPGHAGVKGNDRGDTLAGKATLTSGLLLGRSEVLRSLRHYLQAQSQARTSHHRSPGGERRGKRKR